MAARVKEEEEEEDERLLTYASVSAGDRLGCRVGGNLMPMKLGGERRNRYLHLILL